MGDWSIAVNPAQRDAYLSRLGFTEIPQVSVEMLYALHRAQVERVPYETLWIKYGELRPIDPAASVAVVAGPGGRGGYCYHLNGAFAVLLDWVGFDVRRHISGVQGHKDDAPHLQRNHLALTVHGLPAADNPDGVWFVDAGLGDG